MTTTTCPCALAVPLDYSKHDHEQASVALALIDELGEWTTVVIEGKGKRYRVSRHCICLHGIVAEKIESYGFEQLDPPVNGTT